MMRQKPTLSPIVGVKTLQQYIIITICTVIITSSVILFVTDRGNIISYTNEKMYGWTNPTFNEMEMFIKSDNTNLKCFIDQVYECKHFSIDLIKQARKQGFRAGYVSLNNPDGDDHAIICFDTVDKGLFFVEPQNDLIISRTDLDLMCAYGIYDLKDDGLSPMPLLDYTISWYMVI